MSETGDEKNNTFENSAGVPSGAEATPRGSPQGSISSPKPEASVYVGSLANGHRQGHVDSTSEELASTRSARRGSWQDVVSSSEGGRRRSFKLIGLEEVDSWSEEEQEGEETSSVDQSDENTVTYDEKDLISGPKMSENCSVPSNILEFQYSFSYDCQVHSNLCVLDPNTLAFISGNLLHFFQVSDRKVWFRRSAGGAGLGHIAKNPLQPHFAVGERGKRPKIIVYEWPTMRVVALLKRGTEKAYTYLSYSVDGELLCSAGGAPDNYFTVWNWRKSRIMLRAKSSGQDVYNAAFSSYMPGNIASAGSAHVRFWKMAQTFTGLKLEGAVGRFGNTEVSDVIGVLAMPDGKVVSGCEWGNILIWEAGLIKAEVTKKGRKGCHNAPISQFEYFNGELVTLGMDGFVKVWYFETIDLADPPDDDRFVEVEPIFELEVGDDLGAATLLSMQVKHPEDEADHTWYAQDGGGGLWQMDLSLAAEAPAPRRLFTSHASGVTGLCTAPAANCVATLGVEGRLHVYSPERRGLLVARTFPAAGHALVWLPSKLASSGVVLVVACADGVIRVVAVDLAEAERRYPEHAGTALATADTVTLLQALKAHSQAATALSLSDAGLTLASGGADRTVFLFHVEARGAFAALVPVGFVPVEDVVTYLAFKPGQESVFLAGCAHGQVSEVRLPEAPTHDTSVSYRYTDYTTRTLVYKNVKAGLRREKNLKRTQRRKERKLARKWQQLERMRAENPGIEINEDAYLADSEPEDEQNGSAAYDGELGSVRWVRYLDDDTVWLSVTGFDAGYLYTYRFGKEEPVESVAVPDDDDLEVSSFMYYDDNKYLFLGMGDGSLRCVRVRPGDEATSNLTDYWSLGMHGSAVSALAVSADRRTLYSAGADGNVFMYSVHPEGGDPPVRPMAPAVITAPAAAEELYGADLPTLEDQCAKAERDRKARLAAERMQRTQAVLWGLAETYNGIVKRNRQLPASQQIPAAELELDPRITPSTRLALEAEADLLRRKLAFPLEKASLQYRKLADFYTDAVHGHGIRVYAVRSDAFVETVRQRKLTEEFDVARALVQVKLEEAQRRDRAKLIRIASHRTVEREVSQQGDDEEIVLAPAPVESFLRGISAFEHKFSARLRRLLDKYHSRKYKRERRQAEWAQFLRKRPDMDRTDPADEELIRDAERSIGDYKLKSDPDYKVPSDQVITTVNKYQQLLEVRKQIDDLLGCFNAEVLALRQRKADLRDRMAVQEAQLRRIHLELPAELHMQPPAPPTMDPATEYPERQFQITEEEIEEEMDRAAPSRWQGQSRQPKTGVEVPPPPADPELQVLRGRRQHDDAVLGLGEEESLDKLVEVLAGGGELQRVDSEVEMDELRALGQDDDEDTAWEKEQRAARLVRKVWEQRELIDAMERQVDAVDEAVEKLSARRLEVQRDATLLRHHLLVLHQELIIVKECEEREETLANKVADKEFDCRDVQNEIHTIQNKLDAKNRDILRCQEREKEVELSFSETVGDNAFVEYLKKVFKKKYRPPKASNAESSDDSTTSSSSDEDDVDEGSTLASTDLGAMRYDETTCPPGCSEELFHLTLRLREQRHEAEREATELRKEVEHLRKEQEASVKRLEKVEDALHQDEEALDAFRREKQQRLNEVETIVILRLSQLQHTRPDGKFEQLKNTLVFNTAVLTGLDRRKQQLDEEAKSQRAKHKKNRTHLHRMVVDVRFMKERLKSLREQIKEAQHRKFGCIVDMTELEQALLKRFIWDLRSSADEIRAEFQGLIKSMQADVRAKFLELKETIEQNTARQNLLLVLVEERNRLMTMIARNEQNKSLEPLEADEESPFDEDIEKLQTVIRELAARRDALLSEAVTLRQKGPLPPLAKPPALSQVPGLSAYHGGCGAEQVPPPPGPWPPACVTALKHPMYLGEVRPSTGARSPPTASTSRTLAARREAVRQHLEAGEQAELRHPLPMQAVEAMKGAKRLSRSLESVLPAGFLRADMRDIPPIPSEEELAVGSQSPPPSPAPDDADAISDRTVEEIFRRVPSQDAQDAVEGFLQRLSSHDGDDVMMRVDHSSVSDAEVDVDPLSEPEPLASDADADPVSDAESPADVAPADDGIEIMKEPTRRRPDYSSEEEDQS